MRFFSHRRRTRNRNACLHTSCPCSFSVDHWREKLGQAEDRWRMSRGTHHSSSNVQGLRWKIRKPACARKQEEQQMGKDNVLGVLSVLQESRQELYKGTLYMIKTSPLQKMQSDTFSVLKVSKEKRQCCCWCLQLGLERFHGVAILGFNSAEWFFSAVGAIMAGWEAPDLYLARTRVFQ